MGTYSTSQGTRLSTSQIDRLIRKAKESKCRQMNEDHGFIFCEKCSISGGSRFDCSHKISVKEAKESGKVELCYDISNINILCRSCHQKLDGLDLKFNNN